MATGKVIDINRPQTHGKIQDSTTGEIYQYNIPQAYRNGQDIPDLRVGETVTYDVSGNQITNVTRPDSTGISFP